MSENNKENINELHMELLNSVSCGVFAYTVPQYEVIFINDEARNIIECGKNDDITDAFKKFHEKMIHPEDRTYVLRDNAGLMADGGEVEHEYRIIGKNGIKYIRSVTKRLDFKNGQKYVLASFNDITGNVRLMKSLKRERKSCREALMKNCEYSFFFDLTEGLVYEDFVTANEISIVKTLGLELPVNFDHMTQKYIKAMNLTFLEKGMEKYFTSKGIAEAYKNGQTHVITEYYIPSQDRYTRVSALISKDDETGHLNVYVIANDITDSRKKEEEQRRALITRNMQLLSLTDEMTDQLGSGILAYTLPERNILVFNQEARKMFDAPEMKSEILNFDVSHRVIPEDKKIVSKAVRKLKKPGDSVEYSFHNLKKDGTIAALKCTTKLLTFADGGTYILSSIIDITEQEVFENRIEEERQRYKAALSIGSFAFFTIDLTEGILTEPLITKEGNDITEELGIEVPAYYDNFAREMFGSTRITSDSEKIGIVRSRRSLIAAYKEGMEVIDLSYSVKGKDMSIRLIVMLHKKDKNINASFIFYINH